MSNDEYIDNYNRIIELQKQKCSLCQKDLDIGHTHSIKEFEQGKIIIKKEEKEE